MSFTPQNIAGSSSIAGVALSPDGSKAVYRVAPRYKPSTDEHPTAALWYSKDVNRKDSAKKLTSGLYNDGVAQWHPSEETIYFLSDRHKAGGPVQIYCYTLDEPGEPALVHDSFKDNKQKVEQFAVSPDGNYIAFSSRDEPTPQDEKKEKEKDDATIWGDVRDNARLRCLSLATGRVQTLTSNESHIYAFTWSPDSKKLAYVLVERPDDEANYVGEMSLNVITINGSSSKFKPDYAVDLNGPVYGVTWPDATPGQSIFALQSYIPSKSIDAIAVQRYSVDSTLSHRGVFYSGEVDDAEGLQLIPSSGGEIAVQVQSGLETRIDIVSTEGKTFTLFSTTEGGILGFDVKKVGDDYVLACIFSSGPKKELPSVWTGRKAGLTTLFKSPYVWINKLTANEQMALPLTTKLAHHHDWFNSDKLGPVQRVEWKGEDGLILEGIAWFPHGVDPSNVTTSLPTILLLHGGPYGRATLELNPAWQHLLSENGYLVLQPNYRGSSGRGSEFACASLNTLGTLDWTDSDRMVDMAVEQGWADKSRLGIGGWSAGGYYTAWGVAQTKTKYKAGIMGAGISDWIGMGLECEIPEVASVYSGAAPWLGMNPRLVGSPIHFVKDVETAILILHGANDHRVPVGQALGYLRGLKRMSKYPSRHQMVTFPREGHGIAERKHQEDILKRVLDHYNVWVK